jgi:hypothetical protein
MAEHLLVSCNLFCTGWEILTFSCRFYTPTNREKLSENDYLDCPYQIQNPCYSVRFFLVFAFFFSF